MEPVTEPRSEAKFPQHCVEGQSTWQEAEEGKEGQIHHDGRRLNFE